MQYACVACSSLKLVTAGAMAPPPPVSSLLSQPEPYLIIIAYLGMVIFAAVSMGAWNFSEPKSVALYSRVLLALGGMFVVALSTVACLGFISAIGIKLTPLSVRPRSAQSPVVICRNFHNRDVTMIQRAPESFPST